ncbi:hypothetical protein TNCV_861941 [Trichonephila clavipes]|nr:hypothetical protein TNCV_861941 [Trichonephila clavipes]
MQPEEKVSNFLSTEEVYWKFIPPKSPNFGGIWEAGVKPGGMLASLALLRSLRCEKGYWKSLARGSPLIDA